MYLNLCYLSLKFNCRYNDTHSILSGGGEANSFIESAVYFWNHETGAIYSLPSLQPPGRFAHSCEIIDNKFIVTGGYTEISKTQL